VNEKIKNLEFCIDECLKWREESFNKLNDSQKTEFIRLKNLVSSTKGLYEKVLDFDKDESSLAKFIDNLTGYFFSRNQRLVILQIERDFHTANVTLMFMYKFIQFEKKWMKLEDDSDKVNQITLTENRLYSHLFEFYIEEQIFKLLTIHKSSFLPRSFHSNFNH